MNDIVTALIKFWPLVQEDWQTVMLVCVLLFTAALLAWSGYQRKKDRDLMKLEFNTLQKNIAELQETVDLVVTIHNDRHPEDGRKFVRKLHHKDKDSEQ